MEIRNLGTSGLRVSAIGLGAPVYGEPSADAVIPNVRRALERGVDLVDTSDISWPAAHEERAAALVVARLDVARRAHRRLVEPQPARLGAIDEVVLAAVLLLAGWLRQRRQGRYS